MDVRFLSDLDRNRMSDLLRHRRKTPFPLETIFGHTFQMTVSFIRFRAWEYASEFSVPFGLVCIAASASTHFFGFLETLQALEGYSIALENIFAPSILSWITMWLSASFTALMIAYKDYQRHPFIPERDNTFQAQTSFLDLEHLTSKTAPFRSLTLAAVSDVQITTLARLITHGRPKPTRLLRISHCLYRIPEEDAAVVPIDDETVNDSLHSSSSEPLDLETSPVSIQDEPETSLHSSKSSGDDCCSICLDADGVSVLIPCGHGLYCRPCANRLLVQSPHECPVCRQCINQVAIFSSSSIYSFCRLSI